MRTKSEEAGVFIGPEDAVVYLAFKHPGEVKASEVREEWFIHQKDRAMFKKVLAWLEAKKPVDPIAFSELNGAHEFNRIWKACEGYGVQKDSWEEYLRIMESHYFLSELQELTNISELAKPHIDAKAVVSQVSDWVKRVEGKVSPVPGEIRTPRQYAAIFMDEIDARAKKGEPDVKWGYPALDRRFWGLQKGRLCTIASRPGIGKSTFCLNVASHIIDQKKKVLYFSTEMDIVDKWGRLISIRTGIDAFSFISGRFSPEELAQIKQESEKLFDEDNFIVCDLAGPSHYQIRAGVDRHRPDVVVIDYIGLCQMPEGENRVHQIGAFMKKVQQMTRNCGVSTILVSQLNRGLEVSDKGKGRPPQLSDLRESGDIEQDSSSVILLSYKPGTDVAEAEASGRVELVADIAKNRHGPMGKVNMTFHRADLRIFETIV